MIVVCGEALMDVFVRHAPDDRLASDWVAGGSAFNVARALAALDQKVALLAGFSQDRFGAYLKDLLRRQGVELAYAVDKPHPTTLALVQQEGSGDLATGNHSFSFYGNGAEVQICVDDLPEHFPDEVTALALGSYALVMPPVGPALAGLVAREHSKRLISLDLNYRPAIVGPRANWEPQFHAVLAHAHCVKASLDDLQQAYGAQVDPQDMARDWIGQGVRLVLVTLGAQGALAFYQGQALSVAGLAVDAVDTVGAGDAFHAGFLAWFAARNRLTPAALNGWSLEDVRQAMAYAVHVSARSCTIRGADVSVLTEAGLHPHRF